MSRKTDRTHAFNLIFQMEFNRDSEPGELMRRYFAERIFEDGDMGIAGDADMVFVEHTFLGLCEKYAEIDREIAAYARGWDIERLVKTDLAILRLAVYELRHDPSVPPKVAINEAVELSKIYSGGDSPAFVNGLLGQVAKSMGI